MIIPRRNSFSIVTVRKYSKSISAYILLSLNLALGAYLVLVVPMMVTASFYTELLLHFFVVQFASIVESGAVLYFLNLGVKQRGKIRSGLSMLRTMRFVQIAVGIVAVVAYSLLYLSQGAILVAIFVCLHVTFSIWVTPSLYALAACRGYHWVQVVKCLQAAVVLSLVTLQSLFPNVIMLVLSYAVASGLMWIWLSRAIAKNLRPSARLPLLEIIGSFIKVISSSFGWLIISFIVGYHGSVGGHHVPTGTAVITQLWLVYRTADNLLAGVFSSRMVRYLGEFRDYIFPAAVVLTLRREGATVLLVLSGALAVSWFLGAGWQVQALFCLWAILNRVCSICNVYMIRYFAAKNFYNLLVLIAGGILGFLLINDRGNLMGHLVVMWLVLFGSQFLYRKPAREQRKVEPR